MIRIDVPGREIIEIEHVVLDYNGTIAFDGQIIEGAARRIRELCRSARVYVLTADTYGTVRAQCDGLGVEIKTFPRANASECKEEIVRALGGKVADALGEDREAAGMCGTSGFVHCHHGRRGSVCRPDSSQRCIGAQRRGRPGLAA